MSTWTLEEVEALRKRNGGGNQIARATWYAKWSPRDQERFGVRPGDPLDKFKQLIAMVYEDKRWYDADASAAAEPSTSKPSRTPARSQPQPAASAAAPSLLSFEDDDVFGGGASEGSEDLFAAARPSAPASGSTSAVSDMFGSLTIKGAPASTSKPSAAAPKPAKPVDDDLDLFGDFAGSEASTTSSGQGAAASAQVDLMGLYGSPAPTGPAGGLQQPQFSAFNGSGMGHAVMAGGGANPGFDDPFLALQQPVPGRMPVRPRMVPPTAQQQNHHQQMQQQQQQQQQQRMMQMQMQMQMQMAQTAALNSDDPFAALHAPKMAPRPMGMGGPRPAAQGQAGFPASQGMVGIQPPRGMMPQARPPPRPANMGMPMPFTPMASANPDPFAGLQ